MKKKTIIREYNLSYKNIGVTGEFSLAFLTDIHNCLSKEEQNSIFSLLEQAKPDVVLIGGDVLVGKKGEPVELAYDFIKKLAEKYKVIYGYGNHEQRICLFSEAYGNMGEQYEKLIAKTNVVRVKNQKIDLNINQIPLTVYGLEPNMCFYKKGLKPMGMEEELKHIFGKREEGRYHILLAHNPRYGKEYLSWGAHLTLSGHYHGGMMLLGKQRGVVSPDYRMLSKDCCGIKSKENAHMIVSAGLGEHTIPFRIHNPREVTVVRVNCC